MTDNKVDYVQSLSEITRECGLSVLKVPNYFSMSSIAKSVYYQWKPNEDITTYELALCTPVLCQAHISGMESHYLEIAINQLPDNAKRHFLRSGSSES